MHVQIPVLPVQRRLVPIVGLLAVSLVATTSAIGQHVARIAYEDGVAQFAQCPCEQGGRACGSECRFAVGWANANGRQWGQHTVKTLQEAYDWLFYIQQKYPNESGWQHPIGPYCMGCARQTTENALNERDQTAYDIAKQVAENWYLLILPAPGKMESQYAANFNDVAKKQGELQYYITLVENGHDDVMSSLGELSSELTTIGLPIRPDPTVAGNPPAADAPVQLTCGSCPPASGTVEQKSIVDDSYKDEGGMVGDKKHGLWRSYVNGVLTEETEYCHGVKHGRYVDYATTIEGNPVSKTGSYCNGQMHGTWTQYEIHEGFFSQDRAVEEYSMGVKVH